MIVTLLFHKAIVACRQASTRPLTVEHHGNYKQRDTQTDESTGNEHILETVALNPRRNGEWNSDANGIAEECNTRKGITGDLLEANDEQSWANKERKVGMIYITVTINDQGQSGITNTAQSECEEGSANANVDPVHTLGI